VNYHPLPFLPETRQDYLQNRQSGVIRYFQFVAGLFEAAALLTAEIM